MNKPTLLDPLPVAPETYAISAYYPIPGLGILPMSAFVILGKHPVVIDAGPCPLSEQFMARLESILDPPDLQFLWLTHTDADHVGAVERLLAAAPHARVVTTFLGAAKMGLRRPIPEDRLHLLNPGDRLDLEDRELVALRPPTYDAPETIAAFEARTRTLFAADSFGAPLDKPFVSAAEIPAERLREGIITWAGVDAPWLAHVDKGRFANVLNEVSGLNPEVILSSHLPPAKGITDALLRYLAAAAGESHSLGPGQAAAEAVRGGG